MTVELDDDSLLLKADNAQDRVYIRNFMGKQLDVSYVEKKDENEKFLSMRIKIYGDTERSVGGHDSGSEGDRS